MSKPRKRKDYTPPIPFERLQELIRALESDAALSRDQRKEIVDALDCLFVMQLIEKNEQKEGRPFSFVMYAAAALVNELVEKHGALVKSAAHAVAAPNADNKTIENIQKAYRRFKAARGFGGVKINAELVAKAVARLPAKSGNN